MRKHVIYTYRALCVSAVYSTNMNKVIHFEQTISMSDVDDAAETEAFDTSGSSSSSDELEPDTTTQKLLEDFPIVEEESDSKPKNVFSDYQVDLATFVLFLSVAKLSLCVVQCFTNWFTNWVCIQLNIVSFCLVLSCHCHCHFCFHFIFIFIFLF